MGRLTVAPAEILSLKAGRLRKGASADLFLFDLQHSWRIDPERFRSKSKNSLYEDHQVLGRVLRTAVDRRTIHHSSRFRPMASVLWRSTRGAWHSGCAPVS